MLGVVGDGPPVSIVCMYVWSLNSPPRKCEPRPEGKNKPFGFYWSSYSVLLFVAEQANLGQKALTYNPMLAAARTV